MDSSFGLPLIVDFSNLGCYDQNKRLIFFSMSTIRLGNILAENTIYTKNIHKHLLIMLKMYEDERSYVAYPYPPMLSDYCFACRIISIYIIRKMNTAR